jgi:hypothetical protein
MRNAPKRIYLQWEYYKRHDETAIWCEDKIHDTDTEYIRADLVDDIRKWAAAWKAKAKKYRFYLMAHKKAKSDWIPVTERMPELYKGVLAVVDGTTIDKIAFLSDDGNFYEAHNYRIKNVTHWQPLPAPPEAT